MNKDLNDLSPEEIESLLEKSMEEMGVSRRTRRRMLTPPLPQFKDVWPIYLAALIVVVYLILRSLGIAE